MVDELKAVFVCFFCFSRISCFFCSICFISFVCLDTANNRTFDTRMNVEEQTKRGV